MGALCGVIGLHDQARITLRVTVVVGLQKGGKRLRAGLTLPPPGQYALNCGSGATLRDPLDCAHPVAFTLCSLPCAPRPFAYAPYPFSPLLLCVVVQPTRSVSVEAAMGALSRS